MKKLEDIDLQYMFEEKGTDLTNEKGEFCPIKLTEVALKEGFKWDEETESWFK